MLDFSEIALSDKALFDEYFRKFHPQASELTFTNLFMWRNFYKFRYTEINGFLCIISVPDDKKPYVFMPVGPYEQGGLPQVTASIREYFSSKGWRLAFKRVEEDKIAYFKQQVHSEKDIIPDPDNSDYVYLAGDLTSLAGKRYDGKRNHINKFKKMYTFEYTKLTAGQQIEECIRIMDEWCAERSCDEHSEFYCEKVANGELLKNFDALGCKGALIKVDGKFEAFTVGEMLNTDTAVIHIEKANSKINGLYTLINQQFCENEWKGCTYINREQDLGAEGLRRAKLSYHPAKMIHKYIVDA